ncbi:tautomerase family protein [Alloacidobacterium sp.]|uniref:tautomerase family protein n=1 Tax=Alloacidobacterium sp. TaxID=2951999 RepID=UPI002D2D0182|nr:tautomerase family protein [Alloacidobacterium sp.]HYK35243.1 tautomerase family protein [Alloacidobacterium sp.]
MPLVRIDVGEAVKREKKLLLADAVYDAMRATIGIPEGDEFVMLTAHADGELIADPSFMGMTRTGEFVVVQITLRRGRSTEKKQALYREIARLFEERTAIAPDNVMIVLTENDLDDWSFGRGEAQYVLNPPAGAR